MTIKEEFIDECYVEWLEERCEKNKDEIYKLQSMYTELLGKYENIKNLYVSLTQEASELRKGELNRFGV